MLLHLAIPFLWNFWCTNIKKSTTTENSRAQWEILNHASEISAKQCVRNNRGLAWFVSYEHLALDKRNYKWFSRNRSHRPCLELFSITVLYFLKQKNWKTHLAIRNYFMFSIIRKQKTRCFQIISFSCF